MARSKQSRQRALKWGHGAEWIAIVFLFAKGYRILARRYLARGGEIDIIAIRKDLIAFVEVKARRDIATGLDAIHAGKISRFASAVDHWLMRNPWASSYVLRCDAIIVRPFRLPHHIEDAFSLPFA
jgi:putative endonuclease